MPHRSAHVPTSPAWVAPGFQGQACVRVLGTRLGRFIEFEFSLDDADLTVELVMPPAAFEEFCAAHNARILTPSAEAAAGLAQLSGRDGRPGLYRRPVDSTGDAANRTDT